MQYAILVTRAFKFVQPSTKGAPMIRRAFAVTAAATTLAVLGVQPAAQASSGCYYPQVCLSERNGAITGRFRDVTSGWQWLGRSFGTSSIRNTRHDDVAYLLTTTGRVICVPPRSHAGLLEGGFTAVRISYRSTC
jgi:hypothetical protein